MLLEGSAAGQREFAIAKQAGRQAILSRVMVNERRGQAPHDAFLRQETCAMISIEDCLALCGLTKNEVLAIAEHEHIPEIAATAQAQFLLNQPHGCRAITEDGLSTKGSTGKLVLHITLTTFILTYALAKGKLALGFAAVAGMLAGVMFTIISFAVAAILARQQFVNLLARTEHLRGIFGPGLEMASALAVLVLGVAMVLPPLASFSCLASRCTADSDDKLGAPPTPTAGRAPRHSLGPGSSVS